MIFPLRVRGTVGTTTTRAGRAIAPTASTIACASAPRIDVSETDQELSIVAEMPGLDQNSIEVSLDDDPTATVLLFGEAPPSAATWCSTASVRGAALPPPGIPEFPSLFSLVRSIFTGRA